MPNQLLRSLPSIERLLERPLASQLSLDLSRDRVRDLLRQITDELREEVVSGQWPVDKGSHRLMEEVELRLELRAAASAGADAGSKFEVKPAGQRSGIFRNESLRLQRPLRANVLTSTTSPRHVQFVLDPGGAGKSRKL